MGAKANMLANPYTYKFLKGLTHSALMRKNKMVRAVTAKIIEQLPSIQMVICCFCHLLEVLIPSICIMGSTKGL